MDGRVGPGHVGGGCYAPAMGEAGTHSLTADHPAHRGRGCYRLDTGEPIHLTTVAAALVAALAGAGPRGAAPASYPDRTSEAWLELERRLELVTKAAATLGSRIPRLRNPRFARRIAQSRRVAGILLGPAGMKDGSQAWSCSIRGTRRAARSDAACWLPRHSVDAMAQKLYATRHGQRLRRGDHCGAHPEQPGVSAPCRRGGSASEARPSTCSHSREAGSFSDRRRRTNGDLGIGREQARGWRRHQDVHAPALLCGHR
jgi:hypothetical protein